MASSDKNLSAVDVSARSGGLQIGIVRSLWNAAITDKLYQGCRDFLSEHGVKEHQIHSIEVPGSFELPGGAWMLVTHMKLDVIICLGCIIKGETRHDEYIANAVAQGLIDINLRSSTPCIFGVLTTDTKEQAMARAGGDHGHKGIEAAATALKMAGLRRSFDEVSTKIGFDQ